MGGQAGEAGRRCKKGTFQFIRTGLIAGTPFFNHHFPTSPRKAGSGICNPLSAPLPTGALSWPPSSPLDEATEAVTLLRSQSVGSG